jgi:NAD(P)-dependent dehydrogenase (short-subunit alcohol dehydrogenase family)
LRDLRDKVAVITGGASGIGLALAECFAREGMKLALADIESGPLEAAAGRLTAHGAEVLAVPTDVSDAAAMDAFGRRVVERFGSAHVVCNNAGVAGGGPTWELSTGDWEFVIGPNLWGVIHGVRVFVPLLVAQNEGHVVNTASLAGLISVPGLAPYNVTKHAVVTLSETLHGELRGQGSAVGVSVLCPGFVKTRIFEPERHRPEGWQPAPQPDPKEAALREAVLAHVLANAMSPEEIAAQVLDAVRDEHFYILTHPESNDVVARRMSAIVEGRAPDVPAPPDLAGAATDGSSG